MDTNLAKMAELLLRVKLAYNRCPEGWDKVEYIADQEFEGSNRDKARQIVKSLIFRLKYSSTVDMLDKAN